MQTDKVTYILSKFLHLKSDRFQGVKHDFPQPGKVFFSFPEYSQRAVQVTSQ